MKVAGWQVWAVQVSPNPVTLIFNIFMGSSVLLRACQKNQDAACHAGWKTVAMTLPAESRDSISSIFQPVLDLLQQQLDNNTLRHWQGYLLLRHRHDDGYWGDWARSPNCFPHSWQPYDWFVVILSKQMMAIKCSYCSHNNLHQIYFSLARTLLLPSLNATKLSSSTRSSLFHLSNAFDIDATSSLQNWSRRPLYG